MHIYSYSSSNNTIKFPRLPHCNSLFSQHFEYTKHRFYFVNKRAFNTARQKFRLNTYGTLLDSLWLVVVSGSRRDFRQTGRNRIRVERCMLATSCSPRRRHQPGLSIHYKYHRLWLSMDLTPLILITRNPQLVLSFQRQNLQKLPATLLLQKQSWATARKNLVTPSHDSLADLVVVSADELSREM